MVRWLVASCIILSASSAIAHASSGRRPEMRKTLALYVSGRGGVNVDDSQPRLAVEGSVGAQLMRRFVAAFGYGYARYDARQKATIVFMELHAYALPQRKSAFLYTNIGKSDPYSTSDIGVGCEFRLNEYGSVEVRCGWRRIWNKSRSNDSIGLMLGFAIP